MNLTATTLLQRGYSFSTILGNIYLKTAHLMKIFFSQILIDGIITPAKFHSNLIRNREVIEIRQLFISTMVETFIPKSARKSIKVISEMTQVSIMGPSPMCW